MTSKPLICLGAGVAALALCSLPQSTAMAMPAAAIEQADGALAPHLQQVRFAARGGAVYRRGGAVGYRRAGVYRAGAVYRGGAVVGGGYASSCDPNYQYCGGGYYGGVYRGGAVIRGGAVARGGAARGVRVAHYGGGRRR